MSTLPLRSLCAAVALATALPAGAAHIILIDANNSFASAPHGAEALYAFRKAANYWNQTLSSDATVRIDIGFAPQDPGVLGSTTVATHAVSVASVYQALAGTGTSALDRIAVAHLSPLDAGGNLSMRLNGYVDPAAQTGIDTAGPSRLGSGNNNINHYLDASTAVLKALKLSTGQAPNAADASIHFSSSFAFDYSPGNGITPGSYDFTAVAVHELGHALGFISGTDVLDYYGYPNGPLAGELLHDRIDNYAIGSTLDLFRYGNGFNPDGSRQLQWAANRPAFFSIDSEHVFNLDNAGQEAPFFSTGQFNGDGHQASHWLDNQAASLPDGCQESSRSVGIMDPTMAACELGGVTQNDLAAFDAMGWNLSQEVLTRPGYHASTQDIYNLPGLAVVAVPEPASAGMLLAGLALIGALVRRRHR